MRELSLKLLRVNWFKKGCHETRNGHLERPSGRHVPKEALNYGILQFRPMNALVDVSFFPRNAKPLNSYRKFWAARFGTAPFLPMSRAEMTQLGWDLSLIHI